MIREPPCRRQTCDIIRFLHGHRNADQQLVAAFGAVRIQRFGRRPRPIKIAHYDSIDGTIRCLDPIDGRVAHLKRRDFSRPDRFSCFNCCHFAEIHPQILRHCSFDVRSP